MEGYFHYVIKRIGWTHENVNLWSDVCLIAPSFVMCSLETDQTANPNNLDRTAVLSVHIVTWDKLEICREKGDNF